MSRRKKGISPAIPRQCATSSFRLGSTWTLGKAATIYDGN